MHLSRTDKHVGVGNVSAIGLTTAKAHSDPSQAHRDTFPFRPPPIIVLGFSDSRDVDAIHSATVAVDADHSCQLTGGRCTEDCDALRVRRRRVHSWDLTKELVAGSDA
jgi:hypothetical protein